MISFHYSNLILVVGLFCAFVVYFLFGSHDKGSGIGSGIVSMFGFLVSCVIFLVSIVIYLMVKP
jgi:hypothetical protein